MLLSGLLINFITPAFFGITAYGEFIAANALVFLIHKTIDIISEPLIRFTRHAHLIFVSLALNLVVIAVFFIIDEIFSIGSSVLLLAMLLSSSVILSLHALVRKRAVLAFQLAVAAIFVLLLMQSRRFGFTIEQIMALSTLIPASFAIAFIIINGSGLPTGVEFRVAIRGLIRSVPQLLSITAVYNILTNALPLILSFTLGARDLGIFKIATSVVQSANALFPINTRAIFTAMVKGGENLFPALSRVAIFYFSLVGITLLAIGLIFPEISHYMVLAAVFPALYWTMLAERYWIAQNEIKTVATINLIVAVLVVIAANHTDSLHMALLLYAIGFALYGLRLAMVRMEGKRAIPILILCPVAVVFGPWAGIASLALAAGLQLFWNRLNFQDIRLISRSI